MAQGRQALYDLLDGRAEWPPVVVPFGLDPFGWHGEQPSYRDVCDFALNNCTLLPKVLPLSSPLAIGSGKCSITSADEHMSDGAVIRRYTLTGGPKELTMEEIRTPGDTSWKSRSRWIESDDDLECFLMSRFDPPEPNIEAVREKERQVGEYGLPYVEVSDPFYTVCEMFPTDDFFVRTLTDLERIDTLIKGVAERTLYGIESLCRQVRCPFILRLIGAELAAPPFMSSKDFMKFEGSFYTKVIEITEAYGVPASFHSHGPIRDVMDIVWDMGYSFMEPFEPPPNGNITIGEALLKTDGRGVVFGGVDDVVLNTGTAEDVDRGVTRCLDEARGTGLPYIISQSSTPFFDPLPQKTSRNYMQFMELCVKYEV